MIAVTATDSTWHYPLESILHYHRRMNKALIFLTILALPGLLSAPALAELSDWYVAPSVLFFDDDGDRALDDSVAGVQVNVGRKLSDRFIVEGYLGFAGIRGYSDANITIPDQDHLELGVNFVTHFNPDGSFSPYVLAGAAWLGTQTSANVTDNRPAGSLGAGVTWRMGSTALSLRAEYRARVAFRSESNLTDRIATLGVQYAFGQEPLPVADRDRDGVADIIDECMDSARGAAVDSAGCELDSDSDGIVDGKDICPETPIGTRVDSVGCDVDADRDGVLDRDDACPNTVPGTPVDIYGCSADTDVDGVLNHLDQCPNTAAGNEVDDVGCALNGDQDGDGVTNQADQCPNTTAGVRVDVNGCQIMNIIELRGVTFATNSDRLLAGAEQVLSDAIDTLMQNPDMIVEVAGHSDSDGNDILNLGLSDRRANTVRDYLINGGVNPDNITARGYGEAQPISDNNTAEGKAENRRVELRVMQR
jgi:outer membrane protein OmpA-like peptidoglycan-associated protein